MQLLVLQGHTHPSKNCKGERRARKLSGRMEQAVQEKHSKNI